MARVSRLPVELRRLAEDRDRRRNWKRWGPYLSERQWGTVREDYSADGSCWEYFPHEHAHSRAYRWGEDGLLGFCDRECRLCFALALWNGQDSILKERLFGLSNPQGNHGEDVKECYYYLDATPTYSYCKALYRYPQAAFPYARLVSESARRGKHDPEFELADTVAFDEGRYFDVTAEYAKCSPDDLLIRLTVVNRGPVAATLHLLPTLWFRNTWVWGCKHEGCWAKPSIQLLEHGTVRAEHVTLGRFRMAFGPDPQDADPPILLTDNETNTGRVFGTPDGAPFVKDAFHDHVIAGRGDAVKRAGFGTKAAAHYTLRLESGERAVVRLRLTAEDDLSRDPLGAGFDRVFHRRIQEADAFYKTVIPAEGPEPRNICRQAYAGLLWSRQFYSYVVRDWLEGDPNMPPPPAKRNQGRNADWPHLFNRDVIAVPDKWEYPWYAAWDQAFHMIPFARIDPDFAKQQLVLFLREWYMHPNGQIPAYEFALSDVNPPVHAWACWRVYKMTGPRGRRDRLFLARVFQKLMLNFTWWVNRKDVDGRHLFAGGFLGLDNIGIFDRSRPLPIGGWLQQADGTAWMAFYCATMLSMALELAAENPEYEDVASKFFEHFVAIADAMNCLDGQGLWDEDDGFYYDHIRADGRSTALKVRSIVGLLPLIAVEVLDRSIIDRLPGFSKRMKWFLENRHDLARQITYLETSGRGHRRTHYLLAIPSQERLRRVLGYMLDEQEFLSPYGIRSLSAAYRNQPYRLRLDGTEYRIEYVPGESDSDMFGGNSNWRGPIWFPLNYLLIEALERYDHFYGDTFQVEYPVGSGRTVTLGRVAEELRRRLAGIFLPDRLGRRPCHGSDLRYAEDPHWRDLVLFNEYFHGETGQGLGASHQTGWTALVTECLGRGPEGCVTE